MVCICITDNVPIRHNWKISYIKIYGQSPVGGHICTGLPMQHLALYIYIIYIIYIYIYIYYRYEIGKCFHVRNRTDVPYEVV